MASKIYSLDELGSDKKRIMNEVREIFFLSTETKFRDEKEKEVFFSKWAAIYFEKWPNLSLLFIDEGSLLGYICGTTCSTDFLKIREIPSLRIFEEFFSNYPAHLHINCHPRSRGKGVGTLLLLQFFSKLKELDVAGCHIVTSSSSRNVDFYKRNGFKFSVEKEFKGSSLMFMGHRSTVSS